MPKIPGPLSDAAFEVIAQRFRVLGDPLRLRILYHIGDGERTVGDLVERAGGTQSNISRHLSTLLLHGLVRRRREGTSVYYSIAELSIFDLCSQVCGGIERTLDDRRRALQ
jgi:ArsR family transcriptional regulator